LFDFYIKTDKEDYLYAYERDLGRRSGCEDEPEDEMDDLEINRVMELEHGLWLAGFDGSDVPRLVFYDPKTQLPTPLGRSLQDIVNGTQSQPQRKKWHVLILGWLESHTVLFAADDLQIKVAEKAAAILK